MANAKKCDRCGKYYDENDRTLWLYNGQPHRTTPLDFCEECMTNLKRWFNKDTGDISDGYHTQEALSNQAVERHIEVDKNKD